MKIVKSVLKMSQMLEAYFRESVISLHAYLHLRVKMDLQLSIHINFLHFQELNISCAKQIRWHILYKVEALCLIKVKQDYNYIFNRIWYKKENYKEHVRDER